MENPVDFPGRTQHNALNLLIPYCTAAQILAARSPWRLNVVRWRFILVGLK